MPVWNHLMRVSVLSEARILGRERYNTQLSLQVYKMKLLNTFKNDSNIKKKQKYTFIKFW